ncbi:type II toxin-antitoxin system VapC family toxin [Candidatus Poriferisodalis sp.]|uniref:type II toxin-antitoxin system VapC family toxin n=1 Tax=Candidatus Poriferisodalis sp. TaxID=3101277 RepID=UPI003AF7B984
MLVDANVLLYAVDEHSPFHEVARPWLEEALNGPRRVGLPWQSLTGFLRIVTNPRAVANPLSPTAAWAFVEAWLDAPSAWIPDPGQGHRDILGRLVRELHLSANLIPDAALAALCIEHGLAIVSADSDFARFAELSWINPITNA